MAQSKSKMPQASMGSYPEAKPEKPASVKKDDACKCDKCEKSEAFKKNIERVQKALARINKMDEIKKAKLLADLPNDLNPILGQGIADAKAVIGNPDKDFPEMDMHAVKMPQGLGVAKPGGEHQTKDPTEDSEAFGLDIEHISQNPGIQMAKNWDASIEVLKTDLDTWVPEALNKTSPHNPNLKGVHRQQGPRGMSPAGNDAGDKSSPYLQNRAKEQHKQVLAEMKTIKPNLPKSEFAPIGKAEDIEKARVDDGLSPQRKASARAARNDRHYSLNDKKAPKATLGRDSKFNNAHTPGALAGRKGEKIYGKPKQGETGGMGREYGGNTQGRTTAGIHTEWAAKHKNPGFAAHSRAKAHEAHTNKLSQIRSAPKPTFKSEDYEFTAKAEDIMKARGNRTTYESQAGLKGVHSDISINRQYGISEAGLKARNVYDKKGQKQAVEMHRDKLSEMRSMKKPALKGEYALTEKAEAILKAQSGIKGVHQAVGNTGSGNSTMGMSVPSKMASNKHKQASYSQAKAQAKTVLSELKGIKPKIP